MDAPLYPPASSYVEPQRINQPVSVQETPLATLRTIPLAWAIVAREIPGMDRRIGNPALTPHLGNFSLESLVTVGVIPQQALERIEPQFRALGQAR